MLRFGLVVFRSILLIALLSVAVYIAPKLTFNDTLRNWVPPSSDVVKNYKSFLSKFETDAFIIVALVGLSDNSPGKHSKKINMIIFIVDQAKKRYRSALQSKVFFKPFW